MTFPHIVNNPEVGRILNHAQADMVYASMVCLNNVSASAAFHVPLGIGYHADIQQDRVNGSVSVAQFERDTNTVTETFPDQHAFAKAYGVE